jgi:hypothetical protein
VAKRGRPRKTNLDLAAATIGRTLGQAMNRLDKWRKQRQAIAAELGKAVEGGASILRELGYETSNGFTSVRKSVHIRNRAIILQPRKTRRMSAAVRKRLSISAKKRWAAAKKAGKTRLG